MAQTNVPLNTPTEQPTRRALLGTMAAAGIVGAAPAIAAGGDVDPHIDWWRRSREAEDRSNDPAFDDDEDASQAMAAKGYALEELIAATPARTMEGVIPNPVDACGEWRGGVGCSDASPSIGCSPEHGGAGPALSSGPAAH